jgi:hypothetical protein
MKSGITHKTTTVSKLIVDTCVFTKPKGIRNQIILNNYFATVGEKLVQDFGKNYRSSKSCHVYNTDFVKNNMVLYPIDRYDQMTLINHLVDGKASGPDSIGPKLVKRVSSPIHIYIYTWRGTLTLTLIMGNQLQ